MGLFDKILGKKGEKKPEQSPAVKEAIAKMDQPPALQSPPPMDAPTQNSENFNPNYNDMLMNVSHPQPLDAPPSMEPSSAPTIFNPVKEEDSDIMGAPDMPPLLTDPSNDIPTQSSFSSDIDHSGFGVSGAPQPSPPVQKTEQEMDLPPPPTPETKEEKPRFPMPHSPPHLEQQQKFDLGEPAQPSIPPPPLPEDRDEPKQQPMIPKMAPGPRPIIQPPIVSHPAPQNIMPRPQPMVQNIPQVPEEQLYMSIVDFKNLLGIVDDVENESKVAADSVSRVQEINKDIDNLLNDWKNNLENMENNITTFDNILFKQ